MKGRLFVDIDGTLAVFKPVDTMETLYEPGYFEHLAPHRNVIKAVKEIIISDPDIEVYILSSVLADSLTARNEKNAWLDKYLPIIDAGHRIFPPCGTDKASYLIINCGIKISKHDVLLDDYTKNLFTWEALGGRGLKLLNGINHTRGTWQSATVGHLQAGKDIAQATVALIRENIAARENQRLYTIPDVQVAGGKSTEVWESDPSAICYIPENADSPSEGYSREDIVQLCDGDELKAQIIFDLCTWQSPSTVLGEWDKDDDNALSSLRVSKEAERIINQFNTLTEPNIPNKTHFMVKVSDDFAQFAGSRETDQLYSKVGQDLPWSLRSICLGTFTDLPGLFFTVHPDQTHMAERISAAQQAAAQTATTPSSSTERRKER